MPMSRQAKNPDEPFEVVEYKFSDGSSTYRRYYRSTTKTKESYRKWIGAEETWPNEFVHWWIHFMGAQVRTIELQNPGKTVVDYDLVTGEYLDEAAASGGANSGD